MRKVAIGVAASIALIGTPAFAAEMPVKAPPAPISYSWTGFYVGGNLGGGWDHSDWTGTNSGTAVGAVTAPVIQTFAFGENGSGALGGGQVGFNYQFPSNVVAGIEADIDGAGIRGSANACSTNVGSGFVGAGTGNFGNCFSTTTRLNDFGTVRGRLGYAFNNILLYGSGGFAWGNASTSSSLTCNGEPGIGANCNAGVGATFTGGTSSVSATFGGWAAGAGAEWRFVHNWSLRVEYLHLQFNGVGQIFSTSGTFVAPVAGTYSATTNSQTNIGVDIARVGLNYLFSW
jgi:outer membrane immunogenic protein